MAWQKQTKFGNSKKVQEIKPVIDDAVYYAKFLKDWDNCRDRHPGQKEVLKAVFEENRQYVFYRAGRKGAKTTTAIDIAWKAAHEKSNRVLYLCYPTIAQGIEVAWEERRLQTCDKKDDSMFDAYVEKVDDSRHIVKFNNGSFIKLIGTWTEARGRGTQPDVLIIDEVQDCSADYIEAMDANLAAKPDSRCIMMGTPPNKRNHYEEWYSRIDSNPRGQVFHYTSYDNIRLPHLKEWLDNKHIELLKAGKEDVWKREYLAEFCYSSSDRILPDAKFLEVDEIDNKARLFEFAERIPVLAISVHKNYFCAVFAVLLHGKMLFITDHMIYRDVWQKSLGKMYTDVREKMKVLTDFCGKKPRKIVWDESESFIDIVSGVTTCRKDVLWQDRGTQILKELMVKEKIHFSRNVADIGLECQNLLGDETRKEIEKNYPLICTTSMLVNEYFSQEKVILSIDGKFDKYQALRDMGIPCPVKNKTFGTFKRSHRRF